LHEKQPVNLFVMKEYCITGHRQGDDDDEYMYEEWIERESILEARDYVESLGEEFSYYVIESADGEEWYSSQET